MKSLIEYSNPLFGRFDLVMDLKPMDYYENSLFYKDFCEEDNVGLYSVFGGIPYYNSFIDENISVEDKINKLIASPCARLENEVSTYLKFEFSKITNANEVFETLSKGHSKFSDILSQSHVSSSPALTDPLDKLIRIGVIENNTNK